MGNVQNYMTRSDDKKSNDFVMNKYFRKMYVSILLANTEELVNLNL